MEKAHQIIRINTISVRLIYTLIRQITPKKTIQSNQLQIITRKVLNTQTIEQRTEQLKWL